TQSVTVAETVPAVTIAMAVAGNNINIAGAEAAGGRPLGSTVTRIGANSTFQVAVTDNGANKNYTATVNAAGTSWSATIPSTDALALANGTATVSAQVTDANGNPSAIATQSVTVAETLPTVAITTPIAGDNILNRSEAAAGVSLCGTVTGVAANSTFQLTVTDNGVTKSYTATVNHAATGWRATMRSTDALA